MRRFLVVALLCCFSLHSFTFSNSPEKIKTLLLFNFIKFMEWEGNSNTISIGFIGNDEVLYNSFAEIAKQKSIGDKKITLEKIADPAAASNFNVIYITESNSVDLSKLQALPNTVLVTEKDGLAKKGSFINFITVDGKLRFEINKSVFEKSKVKVSSQLLSMAIVV